MLPSSSSLEAFASYISKLNGLVSGDRTRVYKVYRDVFPYFVYEACLWRLTDTKLELRFSFAQEDVKGNTMYRYTPSFSCDFSNLDLVKDCSSDCLLERAQSLADTGAFYSTGLVELISYWKTLCSPYVFCMDYMPKGDDLTYWKNLYFGGLSELFYRNELAVEKASFLNFIDTHTYLEKHENIDSNQLLNARTEQEKLSILEGFLNLPLITDGWHLASPPSSNTNYLDLEVEIPELSPFDHKVMIAVGGGKDSIVSLERLKDLGASRYAFAFNANEAIKSSCDNAGVPQSQRIFVQRYFDRSVVKLNEAGAINGHTPLSAMLAHYSVCLASFFSIKYVVLSNEASANETSVQGMEVNHQYSKSSVFESSFQKFSQTYIPNNPYYFSLLRPFSELCIARDFSKYPQHYMSFRSCNLGSRQGNSLWCSHCSKCLFVFIMLSAFLPKHILFRIFNKDLLSDSSLLDDFKGLVGFVDVKPFECVGTVSEVSLALSLFSESLENIEDRPFLLKQVYEWLEDGICLPYLSLEENKLIYTGEDLLEKWHSPNAVPNAFVPFIKTMVKRKVQQREFSQALERLENSLSHKTILILGLGREGLSSLEFLLQKRKQLNYKHLVLADAKTSLGEDINDLISRFSFTSNITTSFDLFQEHLKKEKESVIEVLLGADYLESLKCADLCIKAPGVPILNQKRKEENPRKLLAAPNCEIICQVDLFLKCTEVQTISVTGTKGKSTTTSLVYECLKAQEKTLESEYKAVVLGNIGVPVFTEILASNKTLAALELSCHQLEFTRSASEIVIFTNLYEEHLDHYDGFEGYANAKFQILKAQTPKQYAILNIDETILMEYLAKRKDELLANYIFFTTKDEAFLNHAIQHYGFTTLSRPASYILETNEHRLRPIHKPLHAKLLDKPFVFPENPSILPEHLMIDASFATLACVAQGLDCSVIYEGLNHFRGLKHRSEYIGTFKGLSFYDDSIATIPKAVEKALNSLDNIATLFIGGLDRGLDYSVFPEIFQKANSLKTLICLKDTGYNIARDLEQRDQAVLLDRKSFLDLQEKKTLQDLLGALEGRLLCYLSESMQDAVEAAYVLTESGSGVLLSPAAASYNFYKNFEARGDDFCKWVKFYAEN